MLAGWLWKTGCGRRAVELLAHSPVGSPSSDELAADMAAGGRGSQVSLDSRGD